MENNDSKYNEKTDIWALGIIFFKMLTKNEHPFFQGIKMTEENKLQIMRKILNENQLNIHPSITKDSNAWEILNGCLQKSPNKRMDILEILDFLQEKNDTKLFLNGSLCLFFEMDQKSQADLVITLKYGKFHQEICCKAGKMEFLFFLFVFH